MDLEYVPLLKIQRELYALPRGMERFREYLRTMTAGPGGDIRLPLMAMNPMGKEHVPAFLDALLAFDADAVGARALEDVRAAVRDGPGAFRVGLVVSDDLKGGWTDRAASEYGHRFETRALDRRGWITGLLWTSETPGADDVRVETAAAILRAAHVQSNGAPRTLGAMLAQEGSVLARAGARVALDADELAYTGEVLAPLLGHDDRPTVIAALFGDAAARKLGYPPLGLARHAGLEWALFRARQDGAGGPGARGRG